MGERGHPVVERLEYNPDTRLVIAVIENKGTVLFPIEQCSNIIPMDGNEDKYRVKTPQERQEEVKANLPKPSVTIPAPEPAHKPPSAEEAERIRAEYKARMKAKQVEKVETESEVAFVKSFPGEWKEPIHKNLPEVVEGMNKIRSELPKPKPKKRGRPKKRG